MNVSRSTTMRNHPYGDIDKKKRRILYFIRRYRRSM